MQWWPVFSRAPLKLCHRARDVLFVKALQSLADKDRHWAGIAELLEKVMEKHGQ